MCAPVSSDQQASDTVDNGETILGDEFDSCSRSFDIRYSAARGMCRHCVGQTLRSLRTASKLCCRCLPYIRFSERRGNFEGVLVENVGIVIRSPRRTLYVRFRSFYSLFGQVDCWRHSYCSRSSWRATLPRDGWSSSSCTALNLACFCMTRWVSLSLICQTLKNYAGCGPWEDIICSHVSESTHLF